ncbi:MAG: response regulator [Pseudomonadota bacterium]
MTNAEPNFTFVGLLGFIGFPLYFFIWKYIFPQPYENLTLRCFCAFLFLPWVLHDFLIKKFPQAFTTYFLLSCFFVMPFFFSFMMLKNMCSPVWVMSTLAGLFLLIILIHDWLIICLMSFFGFIFANLFIKITDGQVLYNHFKSEYIPVYLFALSGGIICSYRKQIANTIKMSFMQSLAGSIAHEMRNPLSSIINAMSVLRTFIPEKPSKNSLDNSFLLTRSNLLHMHKTLEESTLTIQRGNKIIDSILTSMKGERINLSELRKVSALEIIQTTLSSYGFQEINDRNYIFIKNEENFHFFGDKDLFVYVLFNLLKNSLHYKSKSNFQIDITLESTDIENTIRFKDNGAGIPRSHINKIFDSFYTSGKSGGTGLGLHFCKQVIESIEGTITCTSVEDQWTEFVITLPKYDSLVVKELQKEVLKNKTILLVDDLTVCRMTAKKYLAQWQCQVDEAFDGQHALEMMSKKKYDLVLMDIEMPILNGDVAAYKIRSGTDVNKITAFTYENVPIIALSTLPAETLKNIVLQSGMNDFLEKPIGKDNLIELFDTYFFNENNLKNESHQYLIKDCKVLVVDDNDTNRNLLSLSLKHAGAVVLQAANGQEAIHLLEANELDIVLMDLEMPILNGFDAARMIREGKCFKRFSKYQTIPLIALTGNTDRETILSVQQVGMNDHIGKPAVPEHIISKIIKWLSDAPKNIAFEPTLNLPQDQTTWQDVERAPLVNQDVINNLKEFDVLTVQNIFKTFIEDTQEKIDNLVAIEKAMNLSEASQVSHILKGSCGNMGAYKLYLAAKHVNDHARYNTWPDQKEWVNELQTIYAETKIAFEAYLSNKH